MSNRVIPYGNFLAPHLPSLDPQGPSRNAQQGAYVRPEKTSLMHGSFNVAPAGVAPESHVSYHPAPQGRAQSFHVSKKL